MNDVIAVPRVGKATSAGVAGSTLGVSARQAEAADGPWRREFRSGKPLAAAMIQKQKVSLARRRARLGFYGSVRFRRRDSGKRFLEREGIRYLLFCIVDCGSVHLNGLELIVLEDFFYRRDKKIRQKVNRCFQLFTFQM